MSLEMPAEDLMFTKLKKKAAIIPPPELRAVIDEFAAKVAKHGSAFEDSMLAKESSNSQFAFLRDSNHIFRNYYN